MQQLKRILITLLAIATLATACTSEPSADPGGEDPIGAATATPQTATANGSTDPGSAEPTGTISLTEVSYSDDRPGIAVTLRGGTAAEPEAPQPPVTGEPLSAAEIASVLSRIPDLGDAAADQVDYNRPTETRPPPLVGETLSQPFPVVQESDPPAVDSGPLEVLRFQPEGDIDLAPSMSITFNQPMVPLATLEQLDAPDVPVRMSPPLPGRWQWIGTRTLRFEHDPEIRDRLPMATEYRVEVPAGTISASGGTLAEPVVFTFRTPPPQVTSVSPASEGLPLDQIFQVRFNQDIDRDAVLAITSLQVNGESVPVRFATAEELEVAEITEPESESFINRWLAFRAVDELPPAADLTIRIGPNLASTEGPLVNPEPFRQNARTYDFLAIEDSNCGSCEPFSGFTIWFNNPLDESLFDPTALTIDPAIEQSEISVSGSRISIRGNTRGSTTYTVTVPAGLTDTFGQTLGENQDVDFRVGRARPVLSQFPQQLTTLDPLSGDKSVSIASINHEDLRVVVYDVNATDFLTFRGIDQDEYHDLPFAVLSDEVVDLDANDDELTITSIDLGDQVAAGHRQMLVVVTPVAPLDRLSPQSSDYWSNRPAAMWVQSTNIGIDAFSGETEMVTWTTDLRDGSPLAEVSLTGLSDEAGVRATGTSDSSGLVRMALPGDRLRIIHAETGDDEAILVGSWRSRPTQDQARWYIIDDRGIYRPGETVSMKGWVRRATFGETPSLEAFPSGTVVRWTASDWNGNELATGDTALAGLGGFDLTWAVPLDATLGSGQVQFELVGADGSYASGHHPINLQEFRRPEFEVTARNETEGPYFVDSSATVAVEASYFAGGGLPNADTRWSVTTTNTTYRPPNWDGWTFGEWTPWWRSFEDSDSVDFGFGDGQNNARIFGGQTDALGQHYLDLDFTPGETPRPVVVTAAVSVMDVNRQAWDASTSLLVHAGEVYPGLRSPTAFVRRDEPIRVQAVAVDIDGNAVEDRPITMRSVRLEWRWADGSWTEVEADAEECSHVSTREPVECTFTPTAGGRHRITAIVTDGNGRSNQTSMVRWVSGGTRPRSPGVTQEELTLVPGEQAFRPGDVAEILVESPFGEGTGLVTVTRNGVATEQTFDIVNGSGVLEIPITESMTPNVYVLVDVVGATVRTSADGTEFPNIAPRPAFASGQLELAVAPVRQVLTVEATPEADPLSPGQDTSVNVTVTDSTGAPVSNAEVAVIVVDEAVLALSNYELADPLGVFHPAAGPGVGRTYGRRSIVLSDPESMADSAKAAAQEGADRMMAEESGAMMDDLSDGDAMAFRSAAGSPDASIAVRANFDPLANFSPAVSTGADGSATITYTLPDNLTRYRVMVVAAAGVDQFGSAESNITARLPLMVRPSAPRFLNFGDQFELPIVVQNQTDEDRTVEVVVEGTNLVFVAGQGQRVRVPAQNRVEVRFPAQADQAGTARFNAVATSGDLADAATIELPVYTPATAEAFATYGVVDAGVTSQPVLAPVGVFPQVGGLEVTTSSTAVQALTDAVLYLHEYRYSSSDALASRILAVSALDDVLEAFEAEGLPEPAALRAQVQDDISRLADLQNGDGGFPSWQRGRQSLPYRSLHATHALVEARKSGYDVPEETLARALDYVRNIESHLQRYSWYSPGTRDGVLAYAVHILHETGDSQTAWAEEIWQRSGDSLPLEAVAWLWPLLLEESDTIERLFNNRATETAGAATFATDYGEDGHVLMHSARRTDGVILDALISERPDSDLIPKVVAGLLAGQTRGRWNNAQENAFILLALNSYFTTFESVTPDFVARVWLGETYAAEHPFSGRSVDSSQSTVPTAELIEQGDTNIVIQKDGDGRLYYRLGLRYAPDDLVLDPLDRGFVVQRTYEGVQHLDDVYLDDAGVWHIRAGAEVRVRITMINDSRRSHVALLDPLPAGLEPLNPELAVTINRPDSQPSAQPRWWGWSWYEHQNLRDDRAEAFTDYLWAGSWEYSYLARATTPGTFVVPPTTAEEIFSPEVFGRSGSATVIVEEVEE